MIPGKNLVFFLNYTHNVSSRNQYIQKIKQFSYKPEVCFIIYIYPTVLILYLRQEGLYFFLLSEVINMIWNYSLWRWYRLWSDVIN